jgi:hypothetical protein
VAPPPLWKSRGAPAPTPHLESVQFGAFGWAPAGSSGGAADGTLPTRP